MTAAPCSGCTTVSPFRNNESPLQEAMRGLTSHKITRIGYAVQPKPAGQRAFGWEIRGPTDLGPPGGGGLPSRTERPPECLSEMPNGDDPQSVVGRRRVVGGVYDRAPGCTRCGETLRHGRGGTDRARERDLSDERRSFRRRDAGGGRGERRRDGEVARRVFQANAPGGRAE